MEIDYSDFVISAYLIVGIVLGALLISVIAKYISLKSKLKNAK